MEQIVNKGITPMCGWQWVHQHMHDLDNWHPTLEVSQPGSKYVIHAKSTKTLNEAIRVINGRI